MNPAINAEEGTRCHYSDKKPMGRPRKRRRGSDTEQLDVSLNGANGGQEHATDPVDVRHGSNQSAASNLTAPVVSSVSTACTETADTIQSNLSHTLDPTLDPSSAWDAVHCPDPHEYDFPSNFPGSNTVPNGMLNDLNAVGIPGEYPDISPDMQNTAPLGTSCSCLDQLHSMLQCFRSLPAPSFPASRGPLIKGTNLARAVIRCQLCPLDFPSALQTSMLLTTLIRLIVHGYSTLIQHIQTQAAAGQKITYRVGDLSLANAHLHTGGLDCPMGFNVELEPAEWVTMVKKVLKQDLYGNSQNVDSLTGVMEDFEQRQQTWYVMQLPFSGPETTAASGSNQPPELFLQLIRRMRSIVDALEV
ncbi:MAG: hypothetical protein Q9186_001884 [Xanthomendoza sp. 1 TL-2023]